MRCDYNFLAFILETERCRRRRQAIFGFHNNNRYWLILLKLIEMPLALALLSLLRRTGAAHRILRHTLWLWHWREVSEKKYRSSIIGLNSSKSHWLLCSQFGMDTMEARLKPQFLCILMMRHIFCEHILLNWCRSLSYKNSKLYQLNATKRAAVTFWLMRNDSRANRTWTYLHPVQWNVVRSVSVSFCNKFADFSRLYKF